MALSVSSAEARTRASAAVFEGAAGPAAAVFDRIFAGRPSDALALIDSIREISGEDPLLVLLSVRARRERLTIDDENKDKVSSDIDPLLADLDAVIRTCDERIESDPDDTSALLYRGVAWMNKSQLRSFARQWWTAGRDARRGRRDLERYLDRHPDNPLAGGTLGAFLYFASTIPSVFKFVSRILMMPAGDRREGLDRIESAAAAPGAYAPEFETLFRTILLFFEGGHD